MNFTFAPVQTLLVSTEIVESKYMPGMMKVKKNAINREITQRPRPNFKTIKNLTTLKKSALSATRVS